MEYTAELFGPCAMWRWTNQKLCQTKVRCWISTMCRRASSCASGAQQKKNYLLHVRCEQIFLSIWTELNCWSAFFCHSLPCDVVLCMEPNQKPLWFALLQHSAWSYIKLCPESSDLRKNKFESVELVVCAIISNLFIGGKIDAHLLRLPVRNASASPRLGVLLLFCQTVHSLVRMHQSGNTEAPRKDGKRQTPYQDDPGGRKDERKVAIL
jgi:hypothetical protein